MFSVGQRVLVIAPRIVANDGGGDLDDKDPTSRDFVHATFGDDGHVFAVEEHDGRRTAVYLVRFIRTATMAHVDPSQVTAWEEIKDKAGQTEYWLLSCGTNAVQVLRKGEVWKIVSIVPNADYTGSAEVESDQPMLYWTSVDEAKRHAEMIALGEVHASEICREEANRVHAARIEAERGVYQQLAVAQQKIADLESELRDVEQEKLDRMSDLEKKVDTLAEQVAMLVGLMTKGASS